MSIKNIDTLLKNKIEKSNEIIKVNEMKSFQFMKAENDFSESKIFLKPNFKIKSLFMNNKNRSKSNLGKSLDLSTSANKLNK
jgi:hypothetical protein